jgi:acyl carrier protein
LEPAEVEAALAVHPGVRSAVVGALGSGPQDRRLVAWVVPADGAPDELLAPALRAHLAERLPEPMIPSQIVFLNELPLTANGKVDRRALPAPDGWSAARAARMPYLAPRSDLERRIAEVWQRVLRVDRVGIHDSFFELGGHSLLVAQVQAGLRAALDVDLPLVELFRFPTVAQLAARVAPPPEPPADALPAASARAEKLREGRRRIEQRARLRRGEP